ncbi:MAG: transcriptional regulator [Verrucomicrobia bacterium]|nr:MAG: transcriptional regulator [Verrucomicrobiota bacterium]
MDTDCGVTVFQAVVGAKWKPYLISCLTGGIRRPSEFRKAIAGADRRVLAKQLRELEQTGIIRKKVRSTSKIVEWWKKKRAKRIKNVLQCPMC